MQKKMIIIANMSITSERFGYQWNKYNWLDPLFKDQLINWIGPLTPQDFKGKRVLDVGCGMGRLSYWPLKWGAESTVSFDCDKLSVAAARETLKEFKNAEVLLESAFEMKWKEEFDIAFSIGVIHHLEHPKLAVKNMVKALKPGGTFLIWVYGYEGFGWLLWFLNPLRKYVTSRLPLSFVHAFAYLFSVPLWAFVKIFKGPSPYFKQLSEFGFWYIHVIVFDQLIPEIANYWKKEEVADLVSDIGLKEFNIYRPTNASGWIVVGKK